MIKEGNTLGFNYPPKEDWKTYYVSFTFRGRIPSAEYYYVKSLDEKRAGTLAIYEAVKDFEVVDIYAEIPEEGKYVVTIDYYGITGKYTVYEDDEDTAKDAAMLDAVYDLQVHDIGVLK